MSGRLIYTPLEADVLVSYVTHFPEHAAIMGAQLAMAVPTGRGLGPIGFAIGFEVHDVPLFEADVDLSLAGDLEGLSAPAVFVLAVRDGRIAHLQGFTSDQSPWPEQISGFRIYRETPVPTMVLH